MDKNEEKDFLDFILETIRERDEKEIDRGNLEALLMDEFVKENEDLEKFPERMKKAIEEGKSMKVLTEKDDKIVLIAIEKDPAKKINFDEGKPERTSYPHRHPVYYISSDDEEDEELCDRVGPRKKRIITHIEVVGPDEKTRKRRPRRSRSRRSKRSRSRRRR